MRHLAPRIRIIAAVLGIALALLGYGGVAWVKAGQYATTPPNPVRGETPAAFGLPYEDVAFPSAAGDPVLLRGWWLPNTATRRIVVLVHGRYENRVAHLAFAQRLWQDGDTVLLFDLRGHGDSTPAPCTYGLREAGDVTGAVRFARTRAATNPIAVVGWSLGGASALLAMANTLEIGAVVADSAYANADPLLARNPLQPGLALALRVRYGVDLRTVSPERAIARAAPRPVLLIHGTDDRAVPFAQALRLLSAGGGTTTLWGVPDTGHTGAFAHDPEAYLAHLLPFIDSALR